MAAKLTRETCVAWAMIRIAEPLMAQGFSGYSPRQLAQQLCLLPVKHAPEIAAQIKKRKALAKKRRKPTKD
jgi:hypothetical protein